MNHSKAYNDRKYREAADSAHRNLLLQEWELNTSANRKAALERNQ